MTTESQERGERELFEAWADGESWPLEKYLDSDAYSSFTTHHLWEAWQAARAPLLKDRNFCPRCGKRNAADLIHTCTPPEGM